MSVDSFDVLKFEGPYLIEHDFAFKGLETPIKIRVVRDHSFNKWRVCVSHFIKTPLQRKPYKPGLTGVGDPLYAAHRAMLKMLKYYAEAIEQEHSSDPSWLHQNEDLEFFPGSKLHKRATTEA